MTTQLAMACTRLHTGHGGQLPHLSSDDIYKGADLMIRDFILSMFSLINGHLFGEHSIAIEYA